MGFFENDLNKLVALSSSSVAKHVTSFTLFSDMLPLFTPAEKDRETWERAIDFRPDFDSWRWVLNLDSVYNKGSDEKRTAIWKFYDDIPRHEFTPQQLDEGWREYCRLQHWQEHWSALYQGRVFKEHFARLPNLVQVSCAPTKSYRKTALPMSPWPVWGPLQQKILVTPEDWTDKAGIETSASTTSSHQPSIAILESIAFRASFAEICMEKQENCRNFRQ